MAPADVEDRAWILSQMGHLLLSNGREDQADTALNDALTLFPDYHYALGYLAQVRLAQRRQEEAIALLRRLCAVLPSAENVYALAEALSRSGSVEAPAAYARFERLALAEAGRRDNANRELVTYYAEHGRPADALCIATAEIEARRDLYTRASYAWALSVNGVRRRRAPRD